METLDNPNYLSQHDPSNALGVAGDEYEQLRMELPMVFHGGTDQPISNVVVAGMGGSALAAGLAKDWLNLSLPFEVVKSYGLPHYVGPQTLVIASSHSGNTEETLAALTQAEERGAHVAVVAGGGQLIAAAEQRQLTSVTLPQVSQPRMGVFANLLSLLMVLEAHGLIEHRAIEDLRAQADWLKETSRQWGAAISSHDNLAKQLAWSCAGKTPVVYAGTTFRSIAYKWKISFNENAKNVAFYNELPEFNHNEFIGWSSHPMQKPYAIIDLVSDHDHPQIQKRFEISDRLLSGMRPHATTVPLGGETVLQQMLWGCVLADFVSIYLGILNGVDPTPVALVEKLKQELV